MPNYRKDRRKLILRCPFCGQVPTIEDQHALPGCRTIICCVNDYCHAMPSVLGDNDADAAGKWNERYDRREYGKQTPRKALLSYAEMIASRTIR